MAAFAAPVAAFEGFGAATVGGSGAPVTEVTSLEDSGSGTLRAAVKKGSNQQIVFRVSGVIRLRSDIVVKEQSFLTIDGSTAPPPGITLEGYPLLIRDASQIVVTHLRVRNSENDGITLKRASNVVIDHCSISNSDDENIGITENCHDVTVSWCILGDTRPAAFVAGVKGVRKGSKGMLVANFHEPPVTNLTVHHNLFVNQAQRSPQISTAGLFDLRNNLIRNWQAYGARIRYGARGNVVGNVFASETNPDRALEVIEAGPVYLEDNRGPGGHDLRGLATAKAPLPVPAVRTDPSAELEKRLLATVGAQPRDGIDQLLTRMPAGSPVKGSGK